MPRHLWAESFTLAVDMTAVNLLHSLAVLALNVRWCCVKCEQDTSISSSLASAVHGHSQDLDVLFEWQTLAPKAHQS